MSETNVERIYTEDEVEEIVLKNRKRYEETLEMIDKHMEIKDNYVKKLLSLLIENDIKYPKFVLNDNHIENPNSTCENTEDNIKNFAFQHIEHINGQKLKFKDLYEKYKSWHQTVFPTQNVLSSRHLKEMFVKIGYTFNIKNEIVNMKLKS